MRYDRQILMPEIGIEGQKKLERAVVTVIGCGGLGSPVLTYLAQAGAGTIRLVDGDTVSDTNLNRQFLYREEDIGKKKADLAAEKLRRMNRGIRVEAFACSLTGENAGQILKGSDVVVDCVDSLAVRCIVGRYCLAEDIFLVEGAVQGFYGYAGVLRVGDGHFPGNGLSGMSRVSSGKKSSTCAGAWRRSRGDRMPAGGRGGEKDPWKEGTSSGDNAAVRRVKR